MPQPPLSDDECRILGALLDPSLKPGLDSARRFHGLRHSFGVRCAAAGIAMRTIQEWMGHANIETTQRYAAYAPSAHESEMLARAFPASALPVEPAQRSYAQ